MVAPLVQCGLPKFWLIKTKCKLGRKHWNETKKIIGAGT